MKKLNEKAHLPFFMAIPPDRGQKLTTVFDEEIWRIKWPSGIAAYMELTSMIEDLEETIFETDQ